MPKVSSKLIRIGHSPDPDDAFMFYALAHEKIDMRGFKVEHVIEDIESLNQRAINPGHGPRATVHDKAWAMDHGPRKSGESNRGSCPGDRVPDLLEVTAVSCHAYAYLADRYAVMRSGASIGDDYGPIIVARDSSLGTRSSFPCFPGKRIAIPGKLTTAFLVFQLFLKDVLKTSPESRVPRYEFVPFDQIIDAVKSGEADYGLLIHEGQITYGEHGLEKVVDLGAWWHEKTKLPLPLGADVIRKDLGPETLKNFAALFRESIEYALNHRKEALEYALRFGRGIAPDLNDRFVGMYVNERTLDLGADGEAGFRKLLDMAYEQKIIPQRVNLEFV